jgi:hypothetical protein
MSKPTLFTGRVVSYGDRASGQWMTIVLDPNSPDILTNPNVIIGAHIIVEAGDAKTEEVD